MIRNLIKCNQRQDMKSYERRKKRIDGDDKMTKQFKP